MSREVLAGRRPLIWSLIKTRNLWQSFRRDIELPTFLPLRTITDMAAMKISRSSCVLAVCLLSTACNANPPVDTNGPAAKPASTESLDGVVQKDMAYGDFRRVVLGRGWAPERDSLCKANLGANQKLCGSSPELIICTVCDQMPELSAYSNQGLVVTHFKHGTRRLTVTGSGSLSDWNVSGDKSRLGVSDWHISKAAPDQHANP